MSEALDPLEVELAALRPHDGSAQLRQRLADHRARHAQAIPLAHPWAWRAATLAACALLALNLALALENQWDSIRSGGPKRGIVEATAAQMRRRDPALGEADARQQAVLVLAGSHVQSRPDPATIRARFLFAKEDAAWDMP
jgi:hypothetical protein